MIRLAARYFPVALDLRGRRCLVVGGGEEALKKTRSLLAVGARVHVVSPDLVEGLADLACAGQVTWEPRTYRPGDLQGHFLVFACTDDERANAAVAAEAAAAGVLLNVVDQPARCHFIMPAVVRRGSLTIAVTTDGKSPALAKALQEELAAAYGPEHAEFLEILAALRPVVLASGLPPAARRELFTRIVRSEALPRLLAGDRAGMWACIATRLEEFGLTCPPEWFTSSARDRGTPT